MEKDNLSSLYNALISKGYSTDDLGDENTFRSKMSDKNNRKDLYDYVSGRGDFRIGDYDSYENRLAGDMEGNTSKAGPKAQEVVDEFDSFRRANAQNEEGNREQPIQRPTLKDMVNPQNEPLWMKRGNAIPSKDGLLSNEDLENRLEIAFKSGALEPLRHRDEDASIDKEYTPKTEEKEEDVFENYRNRFGLTQRGTELQEELAQIQGDLHNKYSQEFENTPEYKAIVGKKYNTKEEIDAANKALNDAYNKRYGAVINKEMEPYLKAYEGEIFQRYAPRIQEGLRTVAKNDTSKEVKDLTGEVDDLLEKQHKILRSKGPSSGNAMSALMGSTTYNQSTAKERQELGALEASQRLLEQSQEIIEEAGKKGNTNFFAGLGGGFRDNMDIENFTFGLSEMADSKYLNRALEKAEKGEKLTPVEEKLLEASVVNMATYGYFSSDLGRGYGAGSTTAVSLPFMLEFIANPISGSGNAIAKGLLKFGLKKFGRASAQTAGKGALNAFGRGITSNAGKFAGRLVGDATAALGMEGTTGLERVAAGTLDRLNENYDYSLDDNGKLQVQKTGDTSIGGAFARSAASKFFENQSEMVFNAFRGWSPFMKAVDRVLPGRVGEFMNRIKNSKPGQLYRELKNNPTFKEIVERAQFHGQGEEYLEEVYNNLANVAMGEMTMEDALDLDNNIDTFLGLAPTSVMFGLLGLGSMAADRYSNRKKMRTAFGKMTPEQQAKLTELTQMSKERGNEDIKNFIKATIADADLTPEQKRAEIEYAFELAKQNAIEDLQQEQTPEERATDDAYIQGTEMPVEQRYSANQERVAAEESLREVDEKALDTIDRLLADDASINEVNEVLSGMEEQTATLAWDYYNKSVRMNGVVDSARDDAQETGDAFEANLEKAVVNRTVTTATLMSGVGEEKVQVKVLDNDGTKAVILMDDGSKKMVSSNSLSNVQTMLADDIVNAYREKIETQAKEQTAFTIQNHPKTQIPQPGMQLWNGDIPFIITEVNADGSVRAFPAVLDSKTGQMELKNGSTPIDMSVKESLDLQNDYYNKMDAAVNGVNLSEKQAQNAISPSGGESKMLAEVATQPIAGKTEEAGRYSTESVQPSQDAEQPFPIVMKEDGTPDFVATGKVNSLSYLNDKYKEKALRKIEVTKDAYAKDLEKASVALEKAQTTFDDAPIGREAKAEEALQKAKQAYDNVKRESDFWTSLYEIAKIDAEQPGDKIAEEIRAIGEPMDGRELAAEMLASGRLPLLYSDYKRETGFGEKEAKGLFGLFKSKDNGGLSIKKAGEILMLADQEAGSNFFDPDDANAGRNAILDVLSSVRTRGGLIDYVKNNREAMAERDRAAEQEYEEEQREAWAQENFRMSYADYITYEEVINDIIQEKALSKEEIQEFYNNFAEELNNWNNGRITEETTINERGSVDSGSESSEGLLSTEQLSDNRGIETDISAEANGRADNKGVPASEESIITEIKDARDMEAAFNAKNVQSRMNMTPEERRNTLASETEDVSRKDQIFLNDANQEQIIQSVEDLSGKLNTPVRIARSLDEVSNDSAKRAIKNGRKVKGWFDNGEVVIYLPNAESVDDAIASVLHEIVGHRGLRNLFGTKNESEFDAIMMDLFEKLPLDVRSEIADIAVSRYASNVSIAMDEYLAEQAEKDETPGWWDRVVSAIRDFFRKMGVDGQLSENDVKYLLWRSRKKLESGDLFEHARDVVMRNKLGIDSDETQKASESVPKEGTRFRIVGGIFDSAGKDVEVVERETGNARGMYERTLQTAGYKMRESWQDSMLGLKEAQDAIAKATHSRILDYENAYMAENALSSRSLAEINAYRELVYNPILEEIARMKKQGAKYEDISDYLITKHGIERNREMAVRKALAEDENTVKENIERWTKDKKNIWNNDSMSWREKQEELDRIAASYGADMSVDYSGLSAMFPSDDMEETTAEAYKAVEDFEGKFETDPLLDKVKAATTATLDKQRDSGLLNKDTYKSIQDMYQFYVPLRGWEEKTADEVYDYITSETPVFNAPLKTAKGRTSKSDDPFSTIANIAESGILQGNRNLMKQKFLTMVENHPSNLVSVSELWVKYDAVNDKWTAIFPEIPNNASSEEVENIVSQFNVRMEELSKNNPDEYKKASDARDIPYKILPNKLKEHQVIVKRNGKEYVLTINGNPRAAQALNGLTNPNATDNPVIKAFEAINRFLAANFTQRNPAFVISNMFRDGFYSNSVIWVKESPLYAKKYNKNWAKSLKEMGGLVKRYKTNSLDMNNDTDRTFLEFINNGGETGYTFINNSVEEYKGIVAKELKKQNRSKLAPGKAFDILGEAMDTFGRWAEDTSRFAAYRTSREMGRSIARSISDAKETSVNFNKKGSGAKTAGKWKKGNRMNALQAWTSQTARGLYIFWNAGVQGLTNFARLAKRNPGKFAGLASSYFVLGGMMPVINAALASAMGGDGDEDDYYNLPEYVRRNNICIYMGGEWLTIPLPIELKAIYGLGELACGLLSGKENMTGWKLTKKVAEQVSQIMPIDMMEGGGGFSAFVPSYVKPVYEVWTNKDWTGIPIYRENDFNKNMPGWTKAYSSTSPELVKLSEIINEWTGNKYKTGMIDFNPAIVEHLFESYLGGVGTTINQLKKTLMMPFDENLQELRNAPVLSRFMRSADSRSVQKRIDEEYFNNRDRFELIRQEVNGYKKELENPQTNDFDYAKYQTLYNKMINSDEYRKYIEFKEMDKVLKKMKDAFKQSGNEELEAQMFLLKEAMNKVSK